MQAMFHDEADATTVAARLVRDGFAASARRGCFAGEDDDEDQPWVVDTEAPGVMLELLADQYDGWVEHETPSPRAPLDLPAAPRRAHGRAYDDVGGGT